MTLHPQGKAGVNILKRRYDQVKAYIIKKLGQSETITFDKLADLSEEELQPQFDGKVLWYLVTVKLDLEARGLIERVPKTSPHQIRLKKLVS